MKKATKNKAIEMIRACKKNKKNVPIKSLMNISKLSCIIHNDDIDEDEIKLFTNDIKKYGINYISMPVKDLLVTIGVKSSPYYLKQFKEEYTPEQKRLSSLYNSKFGKKQIGSLFALFIKNAPKSPSEWRHLLYKNYKEDIEEQNKEIIEIEYGHYSKYSYGGVDIKKLSDCLKSYTEKFLVVKTFFGMCFQVAITKLVAEKINKKYRIATDEEDSKGIDAYIGGVEVNIKPSSFKNSDGEKYFNKKVIIVTYEVVGDEIIINYDALIRKIKDDSSK